MALTLVEKSQTITSLRRQIAQLSEDADAAARPKLRALLRDAERSEERRDAWKRFEAQFDETHRAFTRTLVERWPDLSRTELKVCALLKIGMATKEIAEILATSPRTVDGHRRSIRKKLGLAPDDSLTTALNGL